MPPDLDAFRRFVVLLEVVPGVATGAELIAAHVRHLRELDRAGKLVLCGPFTDHPGGMLVLRAADEAEAELLARADPFVVAGARTFTVRTWMLSCEENDHLGHGGRG